MVPSVDPGIHPGVLVGLYDIGTHIDPQFGKEKRKYIFVFELPLADPVEIDGQKNPRTLSTTYNATMAPKGMLRPMIEGWRGKALTDEEANSYDITKVLGKPAQLNVVHDTRNGKTYANIKNVLPAPKGQALTASTTPVAWSVTSLDDAGQLAQSDIPEWIQKKAAESKEYKSLSSGQSGIIPGGDLPEDF